MISRMGDSFSGGKERNEMMNNNTISREVFDGFSGLGLSVASGKTACYPENFRVLADGSLEKREGTRLIASLPDAIRGVCSFSDPDGEVILAVAGDCLYRILEDGQVLSAPCLETREGEIGFFVYGGRLYLLDGVRWYRYEGKCTLTKVHGYTPLYGKNWNASSSYRNEVNEPINCLSPYIRIQYYTPETPDSLYLGMAVESIAWITTEGRPLSPSNYELSASKDWIYLQPDIYAVNLEVCVVLPESYYKDDDFLSCVSAAVYEDFDNSRVFLYGGRDASRLYASSALSKSILVWDATCFPESCGLYFPKIQSLSFGNGQPITAIQRIYDRMLIYFPSSVWVTEPMDETATYDVLFSPLCGHLGCSAVQAVIMTGAASPISVSSSGVYRWKIDPDFLDECITRPLSDPIWSLIDDSFFENAEVCYNRKRAELWFHDRTKKEGRILLYHLDREEWYCYSGVSVDRLFTYRDGVGFTEGGNVFLFDEELVVDRTASEARDIVAICEIDWVDFDGVGVEKRLEEGVFTADLGGGELSVSLEDGEPLTKVTLCEKNGVSARVYEARMPTGRFRDAKLRLVADGPFKQRIYRAELLAQKGKK